MLLLPTYFQWNDILSNKHIINVVYEDEMYDGYVKHPLMLEPTTVSPSNFVRYTRYKITKDASSILREGDYETIKQMYPKDRR